PSASFRQLISLSSNTNLKTLRLEGRMLNKLLVSWWLELIVSSNKASIHDLEIDLVYDEGNRLDETSFSFLERILLESNVRNTTMTLDYGKWNEDEIKIMTGTLKGVMPDLWQRGGVLLGERR
ncbi:hypothetical protein H0H92_008854, partial [Tricholoma furcatifolium]